MKKKCISIILSFMVAFLMAFEPMVGAVVNAEEQTSSLAASHISDAKIDATVNRIAKWYKNGNAKLMNNDFLQYAGSTAGDWLPIGAARYGIQDDYNAYLNAVSKYITNCYATDEKLSDCKATEWERIALAVGAAGGDPTNIGKDKNGNPVNLIADGTYNSIINYEDQGINAYVFGLIALDSKKYNVPDGAKYTRDDIIKGILGFQLKDGGFSWGSDGGSDDPSDPDMSAMAVQALAPYYNDTKVYTYTYDVGGAKIQKTVKQVVDEALQSIRCYQNDDGDMESWGAANPESTDQVIVALCSLGIDTEKDQRFVTKTGKTLLNGLMKYVQPDGGIAHTLDTGSNGMSTDQTLYALAAVKRQRSDMTRLYDYTDISNKKVSAAVPVINSEPVNVTVNEENGAKLTVNASVSDKGTLSYQWYKDNKAINGANSAEYEIQKASSNDSGSYYVVVTNTLEKTTANAVSKTVTVTVNKVTSNNYTAVKDSSTGVYSVEIPSSAVSNNDSINISADNTPVTVNIPSSDFSEISDLNKIGFEEKNPSENAKLPDGMSMLYQPIELTLTYTTNSGSSGKITKFKDPVTISIKLDSDKLNGIDTNKTALYYLDNGTWSKVSDAAFDKNTYTVTAKTPHFSIFAMMAEKDSAKANEAGNTKANGTQNRDTNGDDKNTSGSFENKGRLVQTGGSIDTMTLIISGLILVILGLLMVVKKSKKAKLN